VSFVVACAQFEAAEGDLPRNSARMDDLARRAAQLGARVLVLPELCLTGYLSASEAARFAVTTGSAEMEGVRALARAAGLALCFGFAEKTPASLFNSMAFVERDGNLLAVYRKIHLWKTERAWAEAGNDLVSFGLEGVRCGMWICYDSRFPEAARALALDGVTLGFVGSAWFGPSEEWELALRSRALDNGIWTAGAVTLGASGGAPFRGTSLIVDPHGAVCARAPEGREAVIAAEIDQKRVSSFRERLPLLDDRRPDSCKVTRLP